MKSMIESIKYIAENFGPRIAGSEADQKTIRYIEQQFKSFTSDVELESFPVVGRSLQYLIQFLVWGYFISTVFYFILPPLAIASSILMLLIYYLARFRDRNLINMLAKKSETKNIIARFTPSDNTKQVLIFSGHHDSAFHMPLFEKKVAYVDLIQNGAILGIVFLLVSGIWKTIAFFLPVAGLVEIFSYNLGVISISWWILPDILFIPAFLGLILAFYFLSNMVTKTPLIGANDNLTSVSMLLGIGNYLKENPLKNVEVRLISFGGEEPGLVGSAYYIEKRLAELNNVININYETLGSGTLGIISKERDNNVNHDEGLVAFIQNVGRELDIELRDIKIHYGNTDAGSFSKRGFSGATIACYGKHDVFDLWHSTEDIVENIDENLLQEAFKLSIGIIEELETGNF